MVRLVRSLVVDNVTSHSQHAIRQTITFFAWIRWTCDGKRRLFPVFSALIYVQNVAKVFLVEPHALQNTFGSRPLLLERRSNIEKENKILSYMVGLVPTLFHQERDEGSATHYAGTRLGIAKTHHRSCNADS